MSVSLIKKQVIKEIRNYSQYKNFKMCQECKYNEYNYNVCIANNYSETGDLFKCSDTTCSICKILYEKERCK